MKNSLTNPKLKNWLCLGAMAIGFNATPIQAQEGQANKPRVNNEKPGNRGQVKRVHPHALKLILQGNKKEAIAYLKETSAFEVNPKHTQLLLDIANDKPNAWKYDATTWPWERALPNTALKKDEPTDKFTIAFGGGYTLSDAGLQYLRENDAAQFDDEDGPPPPSEAPPSPEPELAAA